MPGEHMESVSEHNIHTKVLLATCCYSLRWGVGGEGGGCLLRVGFPATGSTIQLLPSTYPKFLSGQVRCAVNVSVWIPLGLWDEREVDVETISSHVVFTLPPAAAWG